MAIGLAFDTETTGVLEFRMPRNSPTQPDLVQLGCILFDDETGREYAVVDVTVKPSLPVEEKAMSIHGKTPEILDLVGIPRRSAVSIFHGLLTKADFILAHNLNFDIGILHVAYLRENVSPDLLLSKRQECTMLKTTDMMKLPNVKRPGTYKWPSLDEAYRKYVDPTGFENAHDAMADIRACKAVYMAVKDLGPDGKPKEL